MSTTFVDVLQQRAREFPSKPASVFLPDGEVGHETALSFAELDERARAIAARLQQVAQPGDRVLLLFPQGLDYVSGFLGALYAGTIAVPIFQPRGKPADARIQLIADNADAAVVLTTAAICAQMARRLDHAPRLADLPWIATDDIPTAESGSWQTPAIDASTLAFLQYTSGSTGVPKGVMVSHGNLMHNCGHTHHTWDFADDSIMVSWLPIFHDMGLIFGILQPLFSGGSCYFMSPGAFVQQPIRWLRAISHYRATHSGAPDFAYELCAQKITSEESASLDLSCLRRSMNAAEPVRAQTMRAFYQAFEPSGLRRTAVCQVFGLAESTLVTTSHHEPATFLDVSVEALEQGGNIVTTESGETRCLVGAGTPIPDSPLVIADPVSRRRCDPGQIGEIWSAGPSIAAGYWQRPEVTAEVFQAHLEDGTGPFLRTGDLGFLHGGELFVCGRIKDVIIIRGSNHYPQDIEFCVEGSHTSLRSAGHCAAFSVDDMREERLVVVQEVERSHLRSVAVDQVFAAIRQTLSEEHELQVHAIVLLKPATIPRTSSGKIQRSACREGYLHNTLDTVASWKASTAAVIPQLTGANDQPSEEAVRTWLLGRLSEYFPAASIDVEESLALYGLDSFTAVSLSGELENWLQRSLSPTLLYDYGSVASLSRYLTGDVPDAAPPMPDAGAIDEPIAIIGMGCRFPGADGPQAFLQLLRNGTDAIGPLPQARADDDAFHAAHADDPSIRGAHNGGFLDDVSGFDASFFGLSPREVELMDPQQRLLLEVSWEALEDAGIVPRDLRGSQTGVFVGISTSDYGALQLQQGVLPDSYFGTGTSASIAANRLSYIFDLRGPSLAVDTACSSSLVALHQACMSLRTGECDHALAGGVNLILSSHFTSGLTQAGMLSPDGRCKTFDASASGYVRGEGCGVVVLKRLSAARRDGDPVLAVVAGTAVNQDGRSNGLTAPNSLSQQAVVHQALRAASVAPAQVGYVEAHGTGTPLGDPIELNALTEVLLQDRPTDQPCWVGSVKTNIGHLEAAAGIAGLCKVVLSLHHGEIYPHLHLRELNPLINLAGTPIAVPTERQTWDDDERIAGISSFGFGGTNAHAVLTAPPINPEEPETTPAVTPTLHLLPLSAQHEPALRDVAQRYMNRLDDCLPLDALCHGAAVSRTPFAERAAIVATDADTLRQGLAACAAGESDPCLIRDRIADEKPKVAFLFTGQGSQYAGMGQRLYETQPRFRSLLDGFDESLRGVLEFSLLDVMWGAACKHLDNTAYTQPALFALEYALADLWNSWGITANAVMGHSVGEFAAACHAGVFSPEDGLRLVAERGRLMHELPGEGVMVSVRADEDQVLAAVNGVSEFVSIAAINGPAQTVLSGATEAVGSVVAVLEKRGIETTSLPVSQAFHSPSMDPILAPFRESVEGVALHAPQIEVISNLTGESAADLTHPSYWVDHVRQPVRFAAGMQSLSDLGCTIFIEIGPKPTLLGMGRNCVAKTATQRWLPSLRPKVDDAEQLLRGAGAAYACGLAVDWSRLLASKSRPVSLPTYPFQRQRLWFQSPTSITPPGPALHPLWQQRLHSPALSATVLATRVSPTEPAYLAEHVVFGEVVAPGASHLSMLLGVAAITAGNGPCAVSDVVFSRGLALPAGSARQVQAVLAPDGAVQILSCPTEDGSADWEEHVTARIVGPATPPPSLAINDIRERCPHTEPGTVIYERMEAQDFRLGTSFRWVSEVHRGENEILCRMKLPGEFPGALDFELHPGLIDSCLQPFFLTVPIEADMTFVPFRVDDFQFYRHPAEARELWCHSTFAGTDEDDHLLMNTWLCDESGSLIASATGVEVRRARRDILLREPTRDPRTWFHQVQWKQWTGDVAAAPAAPGQWLVCAPHGDLGERIAESLRQRGDRCIVVKAGATFERLDSNLFQLDPGSVEDFARLFAETTPAEGVPWRGVLHLWSFDASTEQEADTDTLRAAQRHLCGSTLHLLQAVKKIDGSPPRLVLVTQGTQAAIETDSLQPVSSTLWGLGQAISQEHPELRCLRIDLDRLSGDPVTDLLKATALDDETEERLAVRDGQIYVARLARLAESSAATEPVSRSGTWLVTGGLGGLGLTIAAHLADSGVDHLILVGRRPPSTSAQAQIGALESAGVGVSVIKADITDAADADHIFAVAADVAHPLRGIVHAAGVLDDGLLQNQTWNRCEAVLAPKVEGTWNLHTRSLSHELEAFLCLSSSAVLLGAGGQGPYAAANAFMDSLMLARCRDSLPGLSVNWGPWRDVGMAATLDERQQSRWTDQGLSSLAPQDGLAAIDHLLSLNPQGVAVLDQDWPLFFQRVRHPGLLRFAERLRPDAAVTDTPDEAAAVLEEMLALPVGQRRDALLKHVRAEIVAMSHIEAQLVQPRQRFFDLGVDSLMAVELHDALQRGFRTKLPTTIIFDYPTLEALVDYLSEELDLSENGLTEPVPVPSMVVTTDTDVDELSEDEFDALLDSKLDELDFYTFD